MLDHQDYMRRAIEVARCNPRAPFGAILVDLDNGEVIVEGLNRADANPIYHGEIDAINQYAEAGTNQWSRLRLYTTAEPCCMCQAAIMWAGIPEVVYGTSIDKLLELGWSQFRLKAAEVAETASFAQCKIVGGVLAEQCDRLFEMSRK